MAVILSDSRKQIITRTGISKGIERVEVLDSGRTIRFLFLGGNGLRLRKTEDGGWGGPEDGGLGGQSVRKRGFEGEAAESSAAAQWLGPFLPSFLSFFFFLSLSLPLSLFPFLFFFLAVLHGLQDLSSLTRDWTPGPWQWKCRVLTTDHLGIPGLQF